VWAYYTAYTNIFATNAMIFRLAKQGVTEDEIIHVGDIRSALKAVLPHQAKFIDENKPAQFHRLLDEIESSLLAELQKALEGKEADQLAAARAKEISDALKRAGADQLAAAGAKEINDAIKRAKAQLDEVSTGTPAANAKL
jgi:hypothetical protein